MAITRPRVSTCSFDVYLFCLSSVIGSVQGTVRAVLLVASLLNSTKSPEVDLDIYQDKANDLSYLIGYGLDQVNNLYEI